MRMSQSESSYVEGVCRKCNTKNRFKKLDCKEVHENSILREYWIRPCAVCSTLLILHSHE